MDNLINILLGKGGDMLRVQFQQLKFAWNIHP